MTQYAAMIEYPPTVGVADPVTEGEWLIEPTDTHYYIYGEQWVDTPEEVERLVTAAEQFVLGPIVAGYNLHHGHLAVYIVTRGTPTLETHLTSNRSQVENQQ